MAESNITTISIPKVLAERIKEKMEGTGLNSVSAYVVYVLRQVLSKTGEDEKPKEAFSEEDEKKVKARLRSLGYLD